MLVEFSKIVWGGNLKQIKVVKVYKEKYELSVTYFD